ncbi:MAG: A-macroglobulin complement component, partial [Gammaproteobacteria bacterium]
KHNIKLIMTDGSEMPFSIAIKYKTALPASSDKTFLTLDTTLSANKIVEGEPLEVKVKVTVLDKEAPTPIAVIGIPSGLEVRHDQLKELVASKRVDSYEIIGRNLVLYWRGLKAKSVTEIPVSLIARVPGKFTAPASAAYLYYSDEYKDWQKGMEIEVTASKK